jgi:hypothetical protein
MMKSTFFRSVVVAAIVATAAGVAAMADDIKFEICYDRNGPGAVRGCVTEQSPLWDASRSVGAGNYMPQRNELAWATGYSLDGYDTFTSNQTGMATTVTFLSQAADVPEPVTLALFGSGIVGLAVLARRKTPM